MILPLMVAIISPDGNSQKLILLVVIEHSNGVKQTMCFPVYQLMWLNWVKDMVELG